MEDLDDVGMAREVAAVSQMMCTVCLVRFICVFEDYHAKAVFFIYFFFSYLSSYLITFLIYSQIFLKRFRKADFILYL